MMTNSILYSQSKAKTGNEARTDININVDTPIASAQTVVDCSEITNVMHQIDLVNVLLDLSKHSNLCARENVGFVEDDLT